MVDQVSHRIVLTAALFRDRNVGRRTLGMLADGVRDISIKPAGNIGGRRPRYKASKVIRLFS